MIVNADYARPLGSRCPLLPECLQTVRNRAQPADESAVLEAAGDLMAQVAAAAAPEYVRERINKLSVLVRMLEDQRWRLRAAIARACSTCSPTSSTPTT